MPLLSACAFRHRGGKGKERHCRRLRPLSRLRPPHPHPLCSNSSNSSRGLGDRGGPVQWWAFPPPVKGRAGFGGRVRPTPARKTRGGVQKTTIFTRRTPTAPQATRRPHLRSGGGRRVKAGRPPAARLEVKTNSKQGVPCARLASVAAGWLRFLPIRKHPQRKEGAALRREERVLLEPKVHVANELPQDPVAVGVDCI